MPDPVKFAVPFTLGEAGFATVPQDSTDEVTQCVYAILGTETGSREDDPEFGAASQLFREGGVDLDELRDAVEEWEPRAEVLMDEELLNTVATVRVQVGVVS
jgi:phage baseplate assembly protein W